MNVAKTKLTENQVLEIVELKKQGFSLTNLAERFGVTRNTIFNICHGISFSSITGIQPKKKSSITKAKLTENQVLEIVELKKQGSTCKELSERFNVSPQTISNICNGKRYSSITGI